MLRVRVRASPTSPWGSPKAPQEVTFELGFEGQVEVGQRDKSWDGGQCQTGEQGIVLSVYKDATGKQEAESGVKRS